MADVAEHKGADVSSEPEKAPVWMQAFSGEERDSMLSDDSLTWRNVVLLLVAVVLGGVAMMTITVTCILWLF